MRVKRPVLIVGGGVAGPALALCLAKRGVRSVIVEKAAAPRDAGYKVDVRGVAIDVLDQLELYAEAKRANCNVGEVAIIDRALREVAVFDANYFFGRAPRDLELMRGDLSRLLRERAGDQVEVRFGQHVTGWIEHDDGIEVMFDAGRSERFAMLVGADGLHSEIRDKLFGAPAFDDMGHVLAVFTTDNSFGLERREWMTVAKGRMANVYAVAGQARCWTLLICKRRERAALPDTPNAQKAFMAGFFAYDSQEVRALVERMHGGGDWFFDTMAQVRLPSWSRGRSVLLGDAGYCPSPASGQGTSLALVGASVLAEEIARAERLPTAFAAYERRLRPFVERNQALGRSLLDMTPSSDLAAWMRLNVVRLLPYMPSRNWMLKKMNQEIQQAATSFRFEQGATP